jgi:ICP0-binding domain of Ubiquitin-specific protease 7
MEMSFVSRWIFPRKSKKFARLPTQSLIVSRRSHDLENQGLYSTPTQFYDFLQNRVMIIFRPKFEEPDHDHPEFHLVLSKKQNYDTVKQRILENDNLSNCS